MADDLFFLFVVLVYLIAVFNCVRILSEGQTATATMAWILIHIFAPVVAVPLYYLLGQSRIKGYRKRRRRRSKEFAQGFSSPIETRTGMHRPPVSTEPKSHRTADIFARIFSQFGPLYEPYPGQVELLVDGTKTFDEIFASIASAKHYILVQYYILRSDRLGLEFKDLLIEKSRAGIPVYLLYDDMGSFWLSRDYIRDLRNAGIKVARFLPVSNLSRFFQINFRNHRKLVVIDGKTAFTGGLNVGEEYATRRYRAEKRLNAYWRDSHLRVEGLTVQALEEGFFEDWFFATKEQVALPDMPIDTAPFDDSKQSDCCLQVIPTGPADQRLVSVLMVMQLIQSAKERLWISTPYFVPDPVIMRELELAVLRGVDVRLIIPRKSDNRITHWVTQYYADEIAKLGVRVCEYLQGMLHQKAMLVDDALAAMGTMNLDNRAMFLNFETTVLVHSAKFADELETALNEDFKNSRFFRPESPTSPFNPLIRLRGKFFRIFAPLL